MAKGQAERLMLLLAEVVAAGGATLAESRRKSAWAPGPGNFTGIRISVCRRARVGAGVWASRQSG